MRRLTGLRGRKGHAVIETALLSPWIFLLFCGIVDSGFYYYAFISTANAARVAAMWTSNTPDDLNNSSGACAVALEEMRQLPNIKNAVTCPAICAKGATCTAGPMKITATKILAAATPDGAADATQVQIQYTTVKLFTLPGLGNQFTIQRTMQQRARY